MREAVAPQKRVSELEEEAPPRTRAAATRKADGKSTREEEAPRTKGKLAGTSDPIPEGQADRESAREESHARPRMADGGKVRCLRLDGVRNSCCIAVTSPSRGRPRLDSPAGGRASCSCFLGSKAVG